MSNERDVTIVKEIAAEIEGELVALRRDIHRQPELAGEERRTAGLVADRLRAAGLEVSTGVGGHGVVAALDGMSGGPTVAYRADMDAVGPNGLLNYASGKAFDAEFTSQVQDVGHHCGHDIHTAIGVGVAETLSQMRDRLPGRVVFLFQPAEETLEGARAMIEEGVLDRYTPREIYALHCARSLSARSPSCPDSACLELTSSGSNSLDAPPVPTQAGSLRPSPPCPPWKCPRRWRSIDGNSPSSCGPIARWRGR